MTRRTDLKPMFRNLPKWMILLISFLGFPLFLIYGIASGLWYGFEAWLKEMDAVTELED